MNLLPILLGLFAYSSFAKKDKNKKQSSTGINLGDLSGLLNNPDALALLPHVMRIFDKSASEETKNDAIMALIANPAIFEIAKKFMFNKDANSEKKSESTYEKTEEEKFSDESKDVFKPVEKVAGIEISKKLYNLYDNWYIKK